MLELKLDFRLRLIEGDSTFEDGWYLDVTETLSPGGLPRTTRYGPVPLDFLNTLRQDIIDSTRRMVDFTVDNLAPKE